jgi:lipoyl(octanoyl) transferase
MRICEFHDLGRMDYSVAWELQQDRAAQRKAGAIPDQLLIVEHPPVLTMGRNGDMKHVLASPEILERAGIALHHINRGGDVTYHGPGQIVGYPILDLREWKRDVVAYVRALEQVLIDALADCGIAAERNPGKTGVWSGGAKVAAIGVHISRWVTTHGFALNVETDLSHFGYIVPCGLAEPVTSMRALGATAATAGRAEVVSRLVEHFGRVFGMEVRELVDAGVVAK